MAATGFVLYKVTFILSTALSLVACNVTWWAFSPIFGPWCIYRRELVLIRFQCQGKIRKSWRRLHDSINEHQQNIDEHFTAKETTEKPNKHVKLKLTFHMSIDHGLSWLYLKFLSVFSLIDTSLSRKAVGSWIKTFMDILMTDR